MEWGEKNGFSQNYGTYSLTLVPKRQVGILLYVDITYWFAVVFVKSGNRKT